MLTHINLIRNVGRFDSVSADANIPFQKFTLIYGENEHGKATRHFFNRALREVRQDSSGTGAGQQ